MSEKSISAESQKESLEILGLLCGDTGVCFMYSLCVLCVCFVRVCVCVFFVILHSSQISRISCPNLLVGFQGVIASTAF